LDSTYNHDQQVESWRVRVKLLRKGVAEREDVVVGAEGGEEAEERAEGRKHEVLVLLARFGM
jgi:hypothetical protein